MSRIYSTNPNHLAKSQPPSVQPVKAWTDKIWWWDYDEYDHYHHTGPFIPDITVFEEDRTPVTTPTGILAPDGKMIFLLEEHPGMDFIGFIDPHRHERDEEDTSQNEKD